MEETKIYSKYEDEQQLFAIIQAFELTSEAIGSIIFIFDINKRTALVSKSDAKFLGVPEVTYNVPYKPSTAGAVLPEYVNEYIRIHETVMEGADFAKGIVGLKSAKGIDYIYELSIRALKDKEGKHTGKAVGIYRNVTEYARAVQREIDLNLKTTNVYEEISKRLAGARDMASGVNSVIRFVGEYLDVSRVYIFENKFGEELVGNNTFEWCAPGIEPQIDLLQNMSYAEYGYDKIFEASDVYVCTNVDDLEEPMKTLIKEQNIKAMLHYAIRDNGKFSGFIGLDDCERSREDWHFKRGEVKMLAFVAEMLSMYLMKERNMQRELRHKVREEKYHSALAHNCEYTFVADISDDVIIKDVINKKNRGTLSEMGLCAPCSYNEANQRFLKMHDIRVLTPSGEQFFTSEGLLKMFAQGVHYTSVEYYMPQFDAYYRVVPLMGTDPETGHVVAHIFGYNITSEVEEETRQRHVVEEALKQAEHANAAKTEFLSNMSHDIRTPMNAIIGFTTLAANTIEDRAKVLEYLGKIKSSSNHLLSLINDILDMSRIESGKMTIEETEIHMPTFVNELKNIVQGEADVKGLNFVVNCENIKHHLVMTDKLRLDQVFLNCLSNAVKFTPRGGTITFSVEELPCKQAGCAQYEFRIQDTGIGMKPEFKEHIFEPFERERNSTVSGIQGTGLGMSIVKRIVDMLGGTVVCDSEQGKGSLFTISLQLKVADNTEQASENHIANYNIDEATLEGLNILVVEDNDLNREIAEVIIGEMGANVYTAADGHLAVQMIEKAPPHTYDVVLMDIQMPVMNGIEATRAIRKLEDKEKASIPVIAMTANAFSEDRREALNAGMQEFVTKPIQIDRIVHAIYEVLK